MRFSTVVLVGVVMFAAAAPARADVQLTIQNGQVSLTARNATVREILAEWARVGQTKIVNGDRVPGGPINIELTDVPEHKALELLLRSAAGYVAAPRPSVVANASRYDRILVMPTSSPVTPAPPSQPGFRPPQGSPRFPLPQPFPQQVPIDDDDDDRDSDEPPPNVVLPNPGRPVFNVPPQPTGGQETPVRGQAPVGSSAPGMIVPAPPQSGAPGGQPRRPDDEP